MSCAGYGFLPKSAAFFRFSSARTPSCIRKSAPKTRVSAGVFVLHSRQVGKSASRKVEKKENRARGMGRRLHPAPLCCHKKRIEVSLDALLRCLLFVMFPTAVFFIILRRLCFSRISRSGEIRYALGNPSAVRNVPCAVISLRAGCGSALSNTALFHIVKLLREAS